MAEETVIYEAGNIKITNLRAVFGEKTYPISNITSVEKKETPASGCATNGMIILGILFVFAGLSSLSSREDSWFVTVGIGVLLFVGGAYFTKQAKPTYAVALVTAGGEVKALESQDEPSIKSIVDALNTAIVQKG